jgi:hypothetical protein
MLEAAIKEYDQNKWKVIGQKVGKPAKVCQRFLSFSALDLVTDWLQACEQYAKEHFGGKSRAT